MKQRILNYLIRQWAKIAGIEPDYTFELIMHSAIIRKWIYSCTNRNHIACCEMAIANLATNYGYTQAGKYVNELCKQLLLHKSELLASGIIPPDEVITEHVYDEEIFD